MLPAPAQDAAPPVEEATAESTEPIPDTASTPPVSPVFEQMQGKVERVGPDTFLLLDAQGNPQPVLNMSYREFMEAWRNQQQLAGAGRDAEGEPTIDELRLVGTLEGNYAALRATFDVTLSGEGTVEVPLSLAGALLEQLPTPPAGQAKRLLRYDLGRGGYVATLVGKKDEQVRLELDLIVPLKRDGARATLKMLAPRATKGSMELEIASPIQSIVASEGVVLKSTAIGDGGTKIEAEGIGGETSFSWLDRPAESPRTESVLSASAKMLVTIDGRDVRTQARITVESFGQSFREFVVRLPPGARRVPTGELPAPIESIEDITDEEASEGNGTTEVRVTLLADQTAPVSVDLQTIEALPSGGDGQDNKDLSLTLSGFEVVGALPQDGEVAVVVDDAWQVRYTPNDSVRLVHPSELDLTWLKTQPVAGSVTAAFSFARQPWSQPMRLVPREQRVIAKPTYKLTIGPNEALLNMVVEYQIEGGSSLPVAFAPRFSIEDWTHQKTTTTNLEGTQEVGQQDIETFAEPRADGESSAYFGFSMAYATSRRPTVTLDFRRAWKPDETKSFALKLPSPDGRGQTLTINPSTLTVTADTGLQVTPDSARSQGLVPLPIKDASDTLPGQPPGQQFEYSGVYPPLTFAAERTARPRRVLVENKSKIAIDPTEAEVTQVIEFDVRHQPLSALSLATPGSVTNLRLELLPSTTGGVANGTSDIGTELEVPLLPGEFAAGLPTVPERRIALPHPRLGKFRVRARYVLPVTARPDENIELSLLTVPGTEFLGHTVELETASGKSYTPAAGAGWQIESTNRDDVITLVAEQRSSFLPLVYAGQNVAAKQVEVDRVWVQTWLTPGTVQVRTAFQFRGDTDSLKIELPLNVPPGTEYEVVLDGVRTSDWIPSGGALDVSIPSRASDNPRTLEVRYRLPCELGWSTEVMTQRPRLAGNESSAEPLYWEVIAPVAYRAVSAAPSLVPAFRTEWVDGNWRSTSSLGTRELEQWVGARVGVEQPTRGEHAMLYRGIRDASLELKLVRRELLVLAVSGIVLVLAMALAYIPWLRRPPVLLVMGALVVAAGLAAPVEAVSIAQLGLYGMVCGLVAWVLYLMYGGRRQPSVSTIATASITRDASGSHRPSTLVPAHVGGVSTNAPTISIELTDSNV